MINQKSIDQLKKDVAAKYPEGEVLNDFDEQLFRPNIVIDYGEPYVEEEFYQARIANMMLR